MQEENQESGAQNEYRHVAGTPSRTRLQTIDLNMANANGSAVGSDVAYSEAEASPNSKLSTTDLRSQEEAIAAAANPNDEPHPNSSTREPITETKIEKEDAPEEKRSVTGFKVGIVFSRH